MSTRWTRGPDGEMIPNPPTPEDMMRTVGDPPTPESTQVVLREGSGARWGFVLETLGIIAALFVGFVLGVWATLALQAYLNLGARDLIHNFSSISF